MSHELVLQLAEDGWITRWQLENAFQAQLIYHGSLVDNLLKLGYIEEDRILQYYASTFDLAFLPEEKLRSLTTPILDLFTRDLVVTWRALPVVLADDVLQVASSSPFAERTLEDISFFTGFPVRPLLIRERTLLEAARYHYGIKLPSVVFDSPVSSSIAEHPDGEEPLTVDEALPDDVAEVRDQRLQDALEDTASQQGHMSTTDMTALLEAAPVSGSTDDLADHEARTTSTEAFSKKLDGKPRPKTSRISVPVENKTNKTKELHSRLLSELGSGLSQASERDDIVRGVCGWLRYGFATSIFLTVKKSLALGFLADGWPESAADLKSFSLALNLEGVFKSSAENHRFHFGPADKDASVEHLMKTLGRNLDTPMLVLPVILKGKPAGFFAAVHPLGDNLMDREFPWEQVSTLVTSAFETLILSRKVGI